MTWTHVLKRLGFMFDRVSSRPGSSADRWTVDSNKEIGFVDVLEKRIAAFNYVLIYHNAGNVI